MEGRALTPEAVLAAFPATGRRFYSAAWIAEQLGCSESTAKRVLVELHASGAVERAEGPAWGHRNPPLTYRRIR